MTMSQPASAERPWSSSPSPSVATLPAMATTRRAVISSYDSPAALFPSSRRSRSKASLRKTSRRTRSAAPRRPGRTNSTSSHSGTQRSNRSVSAVPKKPVAPVTAMRLWPRDSAITPLVLAACERHRRLSGRIRVKRGRRMLAVNARATAKQATQATAVVTVRAHGGGSIFADHRAGRKPPLLGLHGWGRTRRDLGGLLDATGHQSVAPDLPGFGASVAPQRVWGAADYAGAVAEQFGAKGESAPFVVVGHSFGGRVAVCMAANHPELVSGVVLMGVPLLRPASSRPPLRYRIIRSAARTPFVSKRRLEAARQLHGSDDYRSVSGLMREVLVRVVNEDYRAELERIRCPVALVWGNDDRVCPYSVAQSAADHIRRVVVLEAVDGAGHDVHLDAPSRVKGAISSLVAELTCP